MDQGPPDSKRPRLFGSHAGVSLLHPTPSPTASQLPHHPAPPPPGQYQPPHPYSRPPEHHPPPPPPPHHPPHTPSHLIIPPPPPPHPGPNHIDDRRNHEPFPPMQEHRQPPPSPAHPQYPYPMKDAMVKPDPGDDTLPQLRRPHSTGNAPEPLPGTPYPTLPPHPPPPEDRRHMSFDAGPQPPPYRQPSYPAPPQTPIAHGTPYEYGPSYGPSHHEMAQYAIPLAATGKRKAQRASQACDSCRQLKAKCDELKPCKSCKEKKLECKYRESVPKAQDKLSSDVLDAIMEFKAIFEEGMGEIKRTQRQVSALNAKLGITTEETLDHNGGQRPISGPPDEAFSYSPENVTNSTEMEVDGRPGATTVETGVDTHQIVESMEARTTLRELAQKEEMDDEPPGPPVAPGRPAIPLNHTTLASKLLGWGAIKNLVQHHLTREGIKFENEFPIQQEERRGLLRLYGRGEGQGTGVTEREGSVDGSWEGHDDYSETGAPSPADCWGTIGGLTSPIAGDSTGAVNVPTLDFTEHLVWKYYQSYLDNIQNMHPLIIPSELKAMVRLFLDNVQRSTPKRARVKTEGSHKNADFVKYEDAREVRGYSTSQYGDVGAKRKRSPGVDASDTPPGVSPVSTKPAKPVFERSIQNALVLLVLALGKICLCKEKIPEVVPVSDPTQNSPIIRNGHPLSPMQGSPPSHAPMPLSSALPSPKDITGSRRGSFQGGTAALPKVVTFTKRNLDVIPGLDYFALATDILGNQLGGSTMKHVYANILAGLYHGQLGRVIESYAYIRQASYALQTRMRPRLDKLAKLQRDAPYNQNVVSKVQDNQMVYAFWSCLQLESDIIAELPLVQSGILNFEEHIPYPNPSLATGYGGFEQRVLTSFSAQLYLRKALNQVHQMLYDPSKTQQSPLPHVLADNFDMTEFTEASLDMRFLPPEFQFHEDDPPANDILAARLRAKYWGLQVITFRPFIKQILHFNVPETAADSQVPASGDFRSDISIPVIGPEVTTENDMDPRIIEYAKKGIFALIQSTRAFHGLGPQRFIITNVFGTAHAQWGNLLVLSAVYKDPILSRFVSEKLMRELLSKTISFFKMVSHASSALSIDMRILQGLERELFYPSRVDILQPNSSFSSTTTNETLTLAPMVSPAPPPPLQTSSAPPMHHGILPPPRPMPQPSMSQPS
ncbi:hypothetical protein GE09DRAFT_147122 [Coniochaeta sp. 2T2.1]|nr:hypothetical protein GE09DRAFT_147122 [Coniochaeta sp. 2T2.1]